MSSKPKRIIIEGITESGHKFRPSDWAERVSGQLSTFKNHRIYYSPMLRPSFRDGNRCVVLDPELKEQNPELYEHILSFAKTNKLKINVIDDSNDENK
jgi:hypothetical protein